MAVSKPMRTELDICQRLESCADNSFGFLVNRSSKSPPVVNGVNGHNLLTAVDSIAEEDEEGGDIDGDDAVTAALAKERTLSTNSNRSVPGLVKIT